MNTDSNIVAPTPMVDQRKILKDLCAAWNSRDAGKIAEFFADDCVYENIPRQQQYHGRAGVEGYAGVNFSAFPDVRFDFTTVVASDDRAALEWVMTGTHTGPLGELAPTGRSFTLPGCSIIQFRDGRIIRNTDYWDFTTFLRQMGVI